MSLFEEELMKKMEAMMVKNSPVYNVDPGSLQAIGRVSRSPARRYTLEEKMSARMDWASDSGWGQGFSHMAVHRAGDMVHVWIVTKDAKSAVLEDGAELYPSDALITKIRLLQQG